MAIFYPFFLVFRVFDPLDVSFIERAGLLNDRASPNAAVSRGVWSPVTTWLRFFDPRTQQITSIWPYLAIFGDFLTISSKLGHFYEDI